MLNRWTDEARYNLYKLRFSEKVDMMRAKGLPVYNDKPLSKREYLAEYDAIKYTFVEKGIKKTNILREVINEQVYEYSSAKAASVARALLKEGVEKNYITALGHIRSGAAKISEELLYSAIEERRSQLKTLKYDKKSIRKIISKEFWGSP